MSYPDEEDPLDIYGSLSGMGYADMSENHVSDDPTADPFSQGRLATGASQSPFSTRGSLLKSQAIAKSSDSISALKSAIERQREPLTTEQAIAASLLALVPTVGGALIGKAVGNPDIPDGVLRSVNLKDWQDTGMAAGGLSGVKSGLVASDQYLKDLKPTEEENRLMEKLAQYENQQGIQLQTQANQAEIRGLEAEQREKEIALRADTAARLIDYRNATKPPGEPKETLTITKDQAVALGDPSLEGKALSPSAVNALGNLTAEQRRDDQFANKLKQQVLPGFINKSGAALDVTTRNKLAAENFGINKTKQLLNVYLANPDSLVGQESSVQQAVAGMLMNAQRQATGSGANFTPMEMNLIKAASPHIMAGDLVGWLKENAMGRDQRVFAETLKGLYQKTQDYALAETYGQFRANVPQDYYPKSLWDQWSFAGEGGGTAPVTPTRSAPPGAVKKKTNTQTGEVKYFDAAGQEL